MREAGRRVAVEPVRRERSILRRRQEEAGAHVDK
jgi:hypothetical protein